MRRLAFAAALVAFAGCAHAATPACDDVQTRFSAARGLNSLQINIFLFEASRKGCVETLPKLFDAGASRLARDRDGDTPLGLAAHAGRDEIVAALMAGASEAERRQIDMPDARGATPLMLALHAGREAVARRLIDAGATLDAADQQGETALSEAAFGGLDDLGETLLRKGAKPDTRDRYGKTPICYAAARGAAKLVGALLDAGIDANARYGGDLTALMWAAGHPDLTATEHAVATVKALVGRGAKLDLVDDRGRSALMIADGAQPVRDRARVAGGGRVEELARQGRPKRRRSGGDAGDARR